MPEQNTRPDATSLSLLRRVQSNEAQAWDRLVSIYGRLVFYWCQKAGACESDIPDIVQDVFEAVFRGIKSFDRSPGHGSFRGWMRTITLNKLRDYSRRRRGRISAVGGSAALDRLLQIGDDGLPAADDTAGDEDKLVLHQVLTVVQDDFSTQTWQAFCMTAVQEMTAAETASQLGITANAVRHAKARVLRRLRQELLGMIEL